MKAPMIFVVYYADGTCCGKELIAWSFDEAEARAKAKALNDGRDWPHLVERVDPLDGISKECL